MGKESRERIGVSAYGRVGVDVHRTQQTHPYDTYSSLTQYVRPLDRGYVVTPTRPSADTPTRFSWLL